MIRLALVTVLQLGCTFHAMEFARFDGQGNAISQGRALDGNLLMITATHMAVGDEAIIHAPVRDKLVDADVKAIERENNGKDKILETHKHDSSTIARNGQVYTIVKGDDVAYLVDDKEITRIEPILRTAVLTALSVRVLRGLGELFKIGVQAVDTEVTE